jgi:aconitate hydratase
LLGVRAVLAVSFERIHRSNLIGMGVLPLRLPAGYTPQTLALSPGDTIEIDAERLTRRGAVEVVVHRRSGETTRLTATAAVETGLELETLAAGGILPFILRRALTS